MLRSCAENGYVQGMNYTVSIDEQSTGPSHPLTADRFPTRTSGRVLACFVTRERWQ
jgi:hypothetical protein